MDGAACGSAAAVTVPAGAVSKFSAGGERAQAELNNTATAGNRIFRMRPSASDEVQISARALNLI